MTNKTYRLYPKAIDDLESIYLSSASEFGVQRTEDYISAIESIKAVNVTQLEDDSSQTQNKKEQKEDHNVNPDPKIKH